MSVFILVCVSPTEAPQLAHENFRAIKPGLSAYSDDPEKVQQQTQPVKHVLTSGI